MTIFNFILDETKFFTPGRLLPVTCNLKKQNLWVSVVASVNKWIVHSKRRLNRRSLYQDRETLSQSRYNSKRAKHSMSKQYKRVSSQARRGFDNRTTRREANQLSRKKCVATWRTCLLEKQAHAKRAVHHRSDASEGRGVDCLQVFQANRGEWI